MLAAPLTSAMLLSDLDDDVCLAICKRTTSVSLIKMSQVCKRFRALLDDSFMRCYFKKYYPQHDATLGARPSDGLWKARILCVANDKVINYKHSYIQQLCNDPITKMKEALHSSSDAAVETMFYLILSQEQWFDHSLSHQYDFGEARADIAGCIMQYIIAYVQTFGEKRATELVKCLVTLDTERISDGAFPRDRRWPIYRLFFCAGWSSESLCSMIRYFVNTEMMPFVKKCMAYVKLDLACFGMDDDGMMRSMLDFDMGCWLLGVGAVMDYNVKWEPLFQYVYDEPELKEKMLVAIQASKSRGKRSFAECVNSF